mgnify:CR=1 FL=1
MYHSRLHATNGVVSLALDAVSGGSLIGLIWLLYRRRRNNRGQINGSGGGGGSAW